MCINYQFWIILKNLFTSLNQSGVSTIIAESSKDVNPGIHRHKYGMHTMRAYVNEIDTKSEYPYVRRDEKKRIYSFGCGRKNWSKGIKNLKFWVILWSIRPAKTLIRLNFSLAFRWRFFGKKLKVIVFWHFHEGWIHQNAWLTKCFSLIEFWERSKKNAG